MWCRVCEIETTETVCSVCGYPTINDNLGSVDNTVVHYCKSCSTPIIFRLNDLTIGKCPICNNKADYLAKDLRPVFPEEKLLISILLNRDSNELLKSNVWASNSRYYIVEESFYTPILPDFYSEIKYLNREKFLQNGYIIEKNEFSDMMQ